MTSFVAGRPALGIESALVCNSKSAMFAAVEIHNKPIFPYRYEVCTLLAVNAWELALKAYIAKKLDSVKLIKDDGTSKPFLDCVACVASHVGKGFESARYNLEILYDYRNKIAHLYAGDMDIVVLGLLKCSVLLFSEFLATHFGEKIHEEANLILLPIGFTRPVSPLDFISSRSAAKDCSDGVRSFLQKITNSCEALQAQGIDDSVIDNFSMALFNETRIKNADLIAAIRNAPPYGEALVVHNVIARANFTTDPSARQVRLREESIYSDIFTESYVEVVANARRKFCNFSQDSHFNEIMRQLKGDPNIRNVRLLDPRNPKSSRKDFYNKRIYDELAKHYTARTSTPSTAPIADASSENVN
jgi:uncharacterized protein DUF3644